MHLVRARDGSAAKRVHADLLGGALPHHPLAAIGHRALVVGVDRVEEKDRGA